MCVSMMIELVKIFTDLISFPLKMTLRLHFYTNQFKGIVRHFGKVLFAFNN